MTMTSVVPLATVRGQEYGRGFNPATPGEVDGGDGGVFERDHIETWAEAIDGWTNSLKTSKSPTTIRQRRWQLRTLAETHRRTSPWKLRLEDLEAWLGGQDWSAESRKSARAAVRSFYTWGVKAKRTKRNPAADLDPISVGRHYPRPASDDTLHAALEQADDRLTLMLLLAAQGGLRVHEIAKLRWDDIVGGEWLLVRGKKDRDRRVWIPAQLRAALLAEHDRRTDGHLGSGFRYGVGDPSVWVFPSKRANGMHPAWVSEVMSAALGDGTTAHQLRHRAADTGLEATGNLAAVQEFMGHVNPETTRIYSRVSDRALRDVGDAL